jgi:hypothetical protein
VRLTLAVLLACAIPTLAVAQDSMRRDVPEAGISVELRAAWPVLEQDGIVYQPFGTSSGAFSVRWGPTATLEWTRDHLGLGGGVRTIERDVAVRIAGIRGRRLVVRVESAGTCEGACSGDVARDALDATVFVLSFVVVGHTPVVVGYRCPASELAQYESTLDAIVRSVARL